MSADGVAPSEGERWMTAAHDLRQHVAVAVHVCDLLEQYDDPELRRRAVEALVAAVADMHETARRLEDDVARQRGTVEQRAEGTHDGRRA